MMDVRYTFMETPIGYIWVGWCKDGLISVGFAHGKREAPVEDGWILDESLKCEATEQLRAYFDGRLRDFDLPLVLRGTDFQKTVWRELANIPFGETTTYGEMAKRVGRPKASRAVGAANGRNPIPIVLPCHRVIGHNGALTGFGGGIPIKAKLLEMEKEAVAPRLL